MDYDDLIEKTKSLLSKSHAAAWILFKLDGGIEEVKLNNSNIAPLPLMRRIFRYRLPLWSSSSCLSGF